MMLPFDRRSLGSTLLVVTFLAGSAQSQGGAIPSGHKNPTFTEPTPHRVYQRDATGKADIPLVLDGESKDVKILSIEGSPRSRLRDGKILGVPTGGPYNAVVNYVSNDVLGQVTIGPFFVGDLWVLAGQSNMEGVGNLVDVTPSYDQVMLLGMDGTWGEAKEPLHWLVDSPDPVHSGDPNTREARSTEQHKNRTKGAGLGLPFGVVMAGNTGVPVGLVACAHGGTSMEGWSPAKKDQGGKSLYGSMLRQVKLAGGKVKGVLWYQGESDANPAAAEIFLQKFTELISAVRSDFNQPHLPFYYVQIGRFAKAGDPASWNKVQDLQRKIPETILNTAVVSVLDLELDDGIHVGTAGLKRLGTRLARIALRELFGQEGGTTPTLDRVYKGQGNSLVVKFRNVNVGPAAAQDDPLALDQPGLANMSLLVNSDRTAIEVARQISGLMPRRHIAGFSLRKQDGTEYPLIYEAMVGSANDSVILKLDRSLPNDEKLFLWYGWGYDPYCNLADYADMAVPMFGPISLDELK